MTEAAILSLVQSRQSSNSLPNCSNTNIRHVAPSRTPATEMRFKKTRVVISSLFGILCLLMIALWARSYTSGIALFVQISKTRVMLVGSELGGVYFSTADNSSGDRFYEVRTSAVDEQTQNRWKSLPWSARVFQFKVFRGLAVTSILLPHSLFVTATLLASIAPWLSYLHWRFSVKTVLIVTTLIALLLGWIMYFTQS